MKTITFILYVFLITPTLQAEVLQYCLGEGECISVDENFIHPGSLSGASDAEKAAYQTWEVQKETYIGCKLNSLYSTECDGFGAALNDITTKTEKEASNAEEQLVKTKAAVDLGDLVAAQAAATAAMEAANSAEKYAAEGAETVFADDWQALADKALVAANNAAEAIVDLEKQIAEAKCQEQLIQVTNNQKIKTASKSLTLSEVSADIKTQTNKIKTLIQDLRKLKTEWRGVLYQTKVTRWHRGWWQQSCKNNFRKSNRDLMSYYNRYLESNAQAEAADRDMQEINNAIARFDGRSLCTNSATVIEESCSQEIKDAANTKVKECLQDAEQAESANPFNEYKTYVKNNYDWKKYDWKSGQRGKVDAGDWCNAFNDHYRWWAIVRQATGQPVSSW